MNLSDYEKQAALYAQFAQTVADIVAALVKNAGGYRLQGVTARAKKPDSLGKKLARDHLAASDEIEVHIKDLAGCRAIFYTNADVEKFLAMRLIQANFHVHDVRMHAPGIDLDSAPRMYTANHYVVSLLPDRLALAEYAAFAGLRCEIQVVTILNHAWAELEHDIVYKAPALDEAFGKAALETINARLKKIFSRYLLAAGHEFDKVVTDFDRLVKGKELFDRDALTAIGQAQDNNERFDAIESFAEHVLPYYDAPAAILTDVIAELSAAARAAYQSPVTPIQTPFGVLPGKTVDELVEQIAKILIGYRYLDLPRVLDTARLLHRLATTDEERAHAIGIAHAAAQHDLEIWKRYGPAVQRAVVDYVAELPEADLHADASVVVELLERVFDPEATSAKWSSSAVMLGRGAVVGSPDLAAIRRDALTQLVRLYANATTHGQRRRSASAMWHAAQPPYGVAPTRELTLIMQDDARYLIEFSTDALDAGDLELDRWFEGRVHRALTTWGAVRADLADDAQVQQQIAKLQAATDHFRQALTRIPDMEAYKALVGFDSIFANGWDQRVPDHHQAEAFRTQALDALQAGIGADNFDAWLARLTRFASTPTDDLATYMHFGPFLQTLATRHPELTLAHLDRVDGALSSFLPWLLAGLLLGPQEAATRAKIDSWLAQGERLDDAPRVLLTAKDLPVALYRAVLASAMAHDHAGAIQVVVRASLQGFSAQAPDASERAAVFVDALEQHVALTDGDWTRLWWFSWLNADILKALDESQGQRVIDWLAPLHALSTEADHILAALTQGAPERALALLDRRVRHAMEHKTSGFTALPYDLSETLKVLQRIPEQVLATARAWFDANDNDLEYSTKRLLEEVFATFPPTLTDALIGLIGSGNKMEALFALEVMSVFEGQPEVLALARQAAAAWGQDEEVVDAIHFVLAQEGAAMGLNARVHALQARRERLQAWLEDESTFVRQIAAQEIKWLDVRTAEESQRVRAMLAQRRLAYDEHPLGNETDTPAAPSPVPAEASTVDEGTAGEDATSPPRPDPAC